MFTYFFQKLRKIKQFKLQDVCRSLDDAERSKMIASAFNRILNAERRSLLYIYKPNDQILIFVDSKPFSNILEACFSDTSQSTGCQK